MSYEDLLNTSEWKEKRKKILKRDNNECQRCGVNHKNDFRTRGILISHADLKKKYSFSFIKNPNFNIGLILLVNNKEDFLIFKTPLKESDIKPENDYYFTINFADKNKIKYPYSGTNKENKKRNIFLEGSKNKKIKVKNIIDQCIIDKEGYYFIKKEQEKEYVKDSYLLHVHHKCYRQNKKIWEQEDHEYITLCNICHLIIHNNQKIPFYDNNGNKFKDLTPCSRCGGRRIIECYKHVQNGICFKCNGAGFI